MRVNVYAEELTERQELITKKVTDPDGAEHIFYGLRFWLKFPNQPWWIHRKLDGEDDDDSSAVTFWGPDPESLKQIFLQSVGAIVVGEANFLPADQQIGDN